MDGLLLLLGVADALLPLDGGDFFLRAGDGVGRHGEHGQHPGGDVAFAGVLLLQEKELLAVYLLRRQVEALAQGVDAVLDLSLIHI